MGIKAGMFTNSELAAGLGKEAGFSVLALQEGNSAVFDDRALPEASPTAVRLLSLLGLQEGKANSSEKTDFDLLLLHLSAKEEQCSEQVDGLDALLGAIRALAQPGTKAGRHLYLVVVLGYGSVESFRCEAKKEEDGCPNVTPDERLAPKLAQLVPQQSYQRKGGHPVEDVR